MGGDQTRPQNPDRIRCVKCSRWHHKNDSCRAAAAQGPARGGFGGNRFNKPRVNEAHLDDGAYVQEVEEEHLDAYEAEGDMSEASHGEDF